MTIRAALTAALLTLLLAAAASAAPLRLGPPPGADKSLTTPALLDSLQRTAFLFFWNEANPTNGLIRDRSQFASACSIASQGFGITAICIAIDHGWVSREEGRARQELGDGGQGEPQNA